MNLKAIDLGGNTVKIVLCGRLDTLEDRIETLFTAECAAMPRNAIVDLSDVSFITYMGIRMFLSIARVMRRRSHNMILFGTQKLVQEVFDQACLSEIIPVVSSEEQALDLLKLQSL
jgi:anti-anti-sigma factor